VAPGVGETAVTPPPPPGIVTLTTDFGRRSSYVGSLRGALLSVSPRLVLADISHEVRPFDVLEAALLLRGAGPAFPPGTVHLAVVDPGVGGERRPLIVVSRGRFFVGPDNGIFTPFLAGAERVLHLDAARVAPGVPSPTFHGRDLFAPAAGRIALGEAPESLGDPIPDPVRLDWPEPRATADGLRGAILSVDPFGNLITNIEASQLPADRRALRVEVAGRVVAGLHRTYGEVAPGELLALIGSSGLLEIAVAQGSAAGRLGLGAGAAVDLRGGGFRAS
jgi:S-adenosyl-L-methionine hydrolase (adenosine-forming)